jgi:cobalt/nickel transport system permease protein
VSSLAWADLGRLDELSRLDSRVHRLDARAKALVTLGFVVAVMSFPAREVVALAPYLIYPWALIVLGHLPLGPIVRRVLVATPFALCVGLLNPWLDRAPVTVLGSVSVAGGWLSFASIMARFLLTVTAALALLACTGMHRLCAGLEGLGLPAVFCTQLLFLHRFLFVVADEGSRMVRAVHLRSVGRRALTLRVAGSLLGILLLRSLDRAQRVYRAMLARGFDGQVRVLRPSRFGVGDALFVLAWGLFFIAARRWDLTEWVGRCILRVGV